MKKVVLFSILVMFICASCAKRTESKLVGEWTIESVGDCGWPDSASWTFYSGGSLKVTADLNAKINGSMNGEWETFTHSFVTPYVRIKGLGDNSLNGNWRVEKVNNRKLIINRVEWLDGESTGAFLRREFVKK